MVVFCLVKRLGIIFCFFVLFCKIFISYFLTFFFLREILKQWTTHGDTLVSSLVYLPENNEVPF